MNKKIHLLLAAVALTLVGAASWALEPGVGRPSGTAAPAAATASLQSTPATASSEIMPAKVPGPVLLSSCTVTKECVCGGGTVEISCSGNVSCTQHARFITCDGVNYNCPPIGSCPP